MNFLQRTSILILLSFVNTMLFAQQTNDFEKIIRDAIAKGNKKIDIPKGKYYLYLKDAKPLTLKGLRNRTIDAHGSEIICKRPSQAIDISNCENVTLAGFSIDYDPLPFTEGVITDMDTINRMWMTVKIFDGYPVENIENKMPDRFQIFDQTTLELRKNLFTYWPSDFNRVERKDKQTFTFYRARFIKEACEQINDKVVFSLDFTGPTRPHGIVITNSKGIELKDITLYASNCFGFFEDQCSGNKYEHCVVTKKNKDPGKSFPRLRSVNADALHSKAAVVGPCIENCELMYHGDDCIAINSSFYMVVGSKNNRVDIIDKISDIKIRQGDKVRFVDYNGAVVADGAVKQVTRADNTDTTKIKETLALFQKKQWHDYGLTTLVLDTSIQAGEGFVVSSLSRAGAGFVIRNNKVGHTRARGILIKASDGLIEGNTVEDCELSGIILAPELFWMEAGYSRDVTIRQNVIRNCMFASSSYGIEQAAAISIVAINAKDKITPAGGFQKIKVIDNVIENSPLPGIMITSLKNGVVADNTISISKTIIRTHGKKFGVNGVDPIWASDTINVKMVNNYVK